MWQNLRTVLSIFPFEQKKISLLIFFLFSLVFFSCIDISIARQQSNYLSPKNRPYTNRGKYCGPHAVWHTLNYYGLHKPIKAIVDDMKVADEGSCSIYQIIQELKSNGISASAVKLDTDKIDVIDKPFILYRFPNEGETIGHFILYLPAEKGMMIALDDNKEPRIFERVMFKNVDNKVWDGTSILINGTESPLVSQVIFSKTIILFPLVLLCLILIYIIFIKLSKKYNNERKEIMRRKFIVLSVLILMTTFLNFVFSQANYTTLSMDQQLHLRGGCFNDDCIDLGQTCMNSPACTSNDDCYAGGLVCCDTEHAEDCGERGAGTPPDCRFDKGHYCSPRRQLTGICGTVVCGMTAANYGECMDGPNNQFQHRCHD